MALLMLYGILGMVFLGMRMTRRYDEGFLQMLQELEDCRAAFWRERLLAHAAEHAGDADESTRIRMEAARHVRRAQGLHDRLRREYRDAATEALGPPVGADPQVTRMLHSLVRTLEPDEVVVAAQVAASAPAEGEASRPTPPPEDPGVWISMYGGGLLGSVVGVGISLARRGTAFDPSTGSTMLVVVTCMVVFALLAATFREAFWVAVAWASYVAFHAWSRRPGGWDAYRRAWRPHW